MSEESYNTSMMSDPNPLCRCRHRWAGETSCAVALEHVPERVISPVRPLEQVRSMGNQPTLWPAEAVRPGGMMNRLVNALSWLQGRYNRCTTRRLRIAESISLGEKRLVAIVSVEGQEFLIGGGAAGMSLLAQLGSERGSAREAGLQCGGGAR
ncbi:MAG: flagellar biosynthetic protein FliO [Acidobacteriaceae bacterium]